MEKQISFHHSVSELGNIQVRQVTEYVKDGKVIDQKYGDPMTPSDTSNMEGWDDRSKDIITAIIDPKVKADFEAEKLSVIVDGVEYKHPSQITGIGVEEAISFDRELTEDGPIPVRRIFRIFDEGEEVSKKYHRSWIMPGDDPTGKDVMSRVVAEKLHTPEVIAAYDAKTAELDALK